MLTLLCKKLIDDPLFFQLLSEKNVESIVALYTSIMLSGTDASTESARIVLKLTTSGLDLQNLQKAIHKAIIKKDGDKLVFIMI